MTNYLIKLPAHKSAIYSKTYLNSLIVDRSSVGKFHKQFDESKIILEGYIHTLRRSSRDKQNLLALLSGGEAFYALAQDEAKVIVNVSP